MQHVVRAWIREVCNGVRRPSLRRAGGGPCTPPGPALDPALWPTRWKQELSQIDPPAGPGGLVDRQDQLHTLPPLAAVDGGLAVCLDRREKILELQLVSAERDRLGVRRAAGVAGLAGEVLANRGVVRLRVGELPHQDVVLLDDRGALRPVDLGL